MTSKLPYFTVAALLALGLCLSVQAAPEPPVIPIGLDAYRMWDRWPQQRIGVRAYMRSTYDRRGGNEGADASHFLYQKADNFNVSLDVEGPGILYFARYNHWHGSPWHYVVDGADHLVRETSTADPNHPRENSVFQPAAAFPQPLTTTWSVTKGADLSWVPIPFERSFQMAYSRTRYGTGYYIYHQFTPGAALSQPLSSWTPNVQPDPDVLRLIGRAGTDIAPQPDTPEGRRLKVQAFHGTLNLPRSGATTVAEVQEGPATLRALEFSVPRAQALAFGRTWLRITWDGRPSPSVYAPMALFHGAGTLYNRDGREYLVKAFPVHIRYAGDRVELASYFPMPFHGSARIELVGPADADLTDIRWSLRYHPNRFRPLEASYFHATYRDHPKPELGKDLVLLDTREAEGGGDWSGHLIGTSWIFSHNANLTTLEGDPRFFFDDSQTPQAYGTGTEEWGGGGDYWGGLNMTLPFAGHPTGARNAAEAKEPEDRIESAYRFLLADLMPFGRNAVIRLEHGGENRSTEHYETVTYWYGNPGATLVPTDEIRVGDPASEKAHDYRSPDASTPYSLISRYEWGVDTLDGHEIYPTQTDTGRVTRGASELTLTIDPKNAGVLLRRKLDYQYPNQRAEVFVADPNDRTPRWKPAGIWYLAGSNTCVYSNPPEELGLTQHIAQTSNRRLRDDEFLLSRELTRGQSRIRLRFRFTPVERPLFPGAPLPQLGWSEIRYTAYSYVLPGSSR